MPYDRAKRVLERTKHQIGYETKSMADLTYLEALDGELGTALTEFLAELESFFERMNEREINERL